MPPNHHPASDVLYCRARVWDVRWPDFARRRLGTARETPGAGCINNLRNIALGILGFESINGVFPAGSWPNADLEPESRLSWYAQILPHIEHHSEYEALETDHRWDAGQNGELAHKRFGVLACYSAPRPVAGKSRAGAVCRNRGAREGCSLDCQDRCPRVYSDMKGRPRCLTSRMVLRTR